MIRSITSAITCSVAMPLENSPDISTNNKNKTRDSSKPAVSHNHDSQPQSASIQELTETEVSALAKGTHTSKLESAIVKAALKAAHKGTVPSQQLISHDNTLNQVALGGDEIFGQQADLIRSAKKEVFFQTFAWEPTSLGAKMLLDGLLDAVNEKKNSDPSGSKLKVNILVNEGVGLAQDFMRWTSKSTRKNMPKRWPSTPDAIIGNYKKSPDFKYASLLKDTDFQVRVHQHRSSNSMHSKTLIVDGEKAALTGANVQSRNHGDRHAYDCGITLSGSSALGLRSDFAAHWNNSLNPDQETTRVDRVSTPTNENKENATGIKALVLTRKDDWNLLNTNNANPQNQAILAAVGNAEKSIQIMTPNFNVPSLISALSKAVQRGVQVDMLISKGFNNERVDNMIAGGTNAAAVAELRSRVKDNELLTVRYFRNPELGPDSEVPFQNGAKNAPSHVKFMAIDDQATFIGSSNMDKTSWHFSAETNVMLFDERSVNDIRSRIFDPAWSISPEAEKEKSVSATPRLNNHQPMLV